jgi:hypothetical protein
LKSGIIVAGVPKDKLQFQSPVMNRIQPVLERSGIITQVCKIEFAGS